MNTPDLDEFVRIAEEIYETRLRKVLESEHVDDFVAIEPETADRQIMGGPLVGARRQVVAHAKRSPGDKDHRSTALVVDQRAFARGQRAILRRRGGR